jgi:hypothetical protein
MRPRGGGHAWPRGGRKGYIQPYWKAEVTEEGGGDWAVFVAVLVERLLGLSQVYGRLLGPKLRCGVEVSCGWCFPSLSTMHVIAASMRASGSTRGFGVEIVVL